MKRTVDPVVRFWSLVDKSSTCWEWRASKTRSGYGRFSLTPVLGLRAHRYSWEITFGEIPDGLCVLHKCDNPPCVNPDHLFLGTHKDNSTDRDSKGRGRLSHGEESSVAKLTNENVKTIRHLYWAERRRQKELAEFFGVSQQTVSRAVNGVTWGHI